MRLSPAPASPSLVLGGTYRIPPRYRSQVAPHQHAADCRLPRSTACTCVHAQEPTRPAALGGGLDRRVPAAQRRSRGDEMINGQVLDDAFPVEALESVWTAAHRGRSSPRRSGAARRRGRPGHVGSPTRDRLRPRPPGRGRQ
ncbi:hypothetical protein HBB16_06530 [Pseudonocardia sp. MCCB 268]|nr:hypothetical protein [Pseudonocardia cytotoxica]